MRDRHDARREPASFALTISQNVMLPPFIEGIFDFIDQLSPRMFGSSLAAPSLTGTLPFSAPTPRPASPKRQRGERSILHPFTLTSLLHDNNSFY